MSGKTEPLGMHHEVLLLDLHDRTGKRHVGSYIAGFGLAAACVGELEHRGRLKVAGADRFGLAAGSGSRGALGLAEAALGTEIRSLKKCIAVVTNQWFSSPINRIRDAALRELCGAGFLEKRTDYFLIVPWRTRYPEGDGRAERALIDRLRTHLHAVDGNTPPLRDDMLLSVLRAMDLLGSVWSERELQQVRPAIEARTKRAPIGRLAWELARDAEAAAAAAAANVVVS